MGTKHVDTSFITELRVIALGAACVDLAKAEGHTLVNKEKSAGQEPFFKFRDGQLHAGWAVQTVCADYSDHEDAKTSGNWQMLLKVNLGKPGTCTITTNTKAGSLARGRWLELLHFYNRALDGKEAQLPDGAEMLRSHLRFPAFYEDEKGIVKRDLVRIPGLTDLAKQAVLLSMNDIWARLTDFPEVRGDLLRLCENRYGVELPAEAKQKLKEEEWTRALLAEKKKDTVFGVDKTFLSTPEFKEALRIFSEKQKAKDDTMKQEFLSQQRMKESFSKQEQLKKEVLKQELKFKMETGEEASGSSSSSGGYNADPDYIFVELEDGTIERVPK